MRSTRKCSWALGGLVLAATLWVSAASASAAQAPLVVAEGGRTSAVVCVDVPKAAGKADRWQRRAAEDLAHYIGKMTGAEPAVLDDRAAIDRARTSGAACFLVGQAALRTNPPLRARLAAAAKKKPVLRADAILAVREGSRVYLAGTNDVSHYHAVSFLLHHWGCRWYLPTAIGECVPRVSRLVLHKLDHVYAPPFEMRNYWISWNGSNAGSEEFQIRNFMNFQSHAGMGHALDGYTRDLVKKGRSAFNVPFADPATARHVAARLADKMAQRPPGGISLAIADGMYTNDHPEDKRLSASLFDKYFLKPAMTDPMMALYGRVCRLLDEKHGGNPTRIGGMAYSNVTTPPQWKHEIPSRLVMWLAPIDIDPIHGYNHPESPPRQEYGQMLRRWAELLQGRVCIYDYDQGMMVWRDLPAPSHQAFRQDVKLYRDAGILGVNTESRMAIATTFLNLHLRGQLLWRPDADVDAMLAEFYPKFYGPAAEPMRRYWTAIFRAWERTIVTEHEHFLAAAIYTPELLAELGKHVKAANEAIAPIEKKASPSPAEKLFARRMEMLRRQWAVLDGTLRMTFASAGECDYVRAAALGRKVLAARLRLAEMNPTFTTRVIGPSAEPREPGGSPAWLPGEVKQHGDHAALIAGPAGTLVRKLPLRWALHRDPHDTGLARGWAYRDADLTYWNAHKDKFDLAGLKDYPTTRWETIRTDLYAQAQGVRHPDGQSFTGYLWYKTKVSLGQVETRGKVHVRFPGLFNECWLYVNGFLVAHRPFPEVWWLTDYTFAWDVDLTGKLKAGPNDLTLRCRNPHHFGGMFRRPFLYRPR